MTKKLESVVDMLVFVMAEKITVVARGLSISTIIGLSIFGFNSGFKPLDNMAVFAMQEIAAPHFMVFIFVFCLLSIGVSSFLVEIIPKNNYAARNSVINVFFMQPFVMINNFYSVYSGIFFGLIFEMWLNELPLSTAIPLKKMSCVTIESTVAGYFVLIFCFSIMLKEIKNFKWIEQKTENRNFLLKLSSKTAFIFIMVIIGRGVEPSEPSTEETIRPGKRRAFGLVSAIISVTILIIANRDANFNAS